VLAFTFPGQGSQRPGMGRAWTEHPSWELVGEASAAAGRDVAALLLDAGAEELTETRNAQLATFTLSLVALDAVERIGLDAGLCAGHSLGEYTALVAAGALSFEDGIRLVVERGEAMQVAADTQAGTMAALMGIDDDAASAACERAEGGVWVANYNAPGQVVLAGAPEAVAAAADIARSLGAKRAVPVKVGGAFHTPLMAPARDRLRKGLATAAFRDPDVPVVANVDARPHGAARDWPGLLSAQLCSPVRWRQSLQELARAGTTTLVEIGPGGVLTGLARRSVPGMPAAAVSTPDDLDSLLATLGGDGPLHSGGHGGEHLYVSERLVLSPASGVFEPAATAAEVQVGGVIGRVGSAEVCSAFAGSLEGLLVIPGERVSAGQPVAWLRASGT
jgi:[acyl-carrier-protein] S-malonyltransferase